MAIILHDFGTKLIALIFSGVLWSVKFGLSRAHSHKVISELTSNPNRRYDLCYRGEDDPNNKKRISFEAGGLIGEGQNCYEHRWVVKSGRLEIYTDKDVLFSKFHWDEKKAKLMNVHDPKLDSTMGQYIVPLFIPPTSVKGEASVPD